MPDASSLNIALIIVGVILILLALIAFFGSSLGKLILPPETTTQISTPNLVAPKTSPPNLNLNTPFLNPSTSRHGLYVVNFGEAQGHLLPLNFNKDMKSIVHVGSTTYGISSDGSLFSILNGQVSPIAFGRSVQDMVNIGGNPILLSEGELWTLQGKLTLPGYTFNEPITHISAPRDSSVLFFTTENCSVLYDMRRKQVISITEGPETRIYGYDMNSYLARHPDEITNFSSTDGRFLQGACEAVLDSSGAIIALPPNMKIGPVRLTHLSLADNMILFSARSTSALPETLTLPDPEMIFFPA